MAGFEWIEKIPTFIRWLIFLPAIFIIHVVMSFIASITISYAIGPESGDIFSFLFYKSYYNFISLGLSLTISCLLVPKGKIIVASIYLGVFLILAGIGINKINNGATLAEPLWKIIFEEISSLAAYIFALVVVILNEKEKSNTHSQTAEESIYS